MMRSVTVEDFRNLAETGLPEMSAQRIEETIGPLAYLRIIVIHLQIGCQEWSQQPWPHGALMIGAVATALVALVAAFVIRIARSKRAQAVGRKQFPLHHVYHPVRSLAAEQGVRQANSEYLVGPYGAVRPRLPNHVEQAAIRFVPERAFEAAAGASGQRGIVLGFGPLTESARQILHYAQRVVPQRLNLHRLAFARRNHPIADLGIHPGELNPA